MMCKHSGHLIQRHDPGQAGRRVFTDTAADQRLRIDAPAHQQTRHSVLDEENRRAAGFFLRHGLFCLLLIGLLRKQDVANIQPQRLLKHRGALIDIRTERGFLLIQISGHIDILSAFAGKHKDQARLGKIAAPQLLFRRRW